MLFDVVKSLCASQNITVAELERGIKSGNGTIRKWNTSFPGVDKLEAVADYFGVSTDFLLGREASHLVNAISKLPPQKRDLVQRYVEVIQKE